MSVVATLSSSQKLAQWILHNAEEPVTHLKLQKLVFYCYGVCLARDARSEIGEVRFEAWQHGPVNRDLWTQYKDSGANPLSPTVEPAPVYSDQTSELLTDVLAVYGALSAWSLRNESHLETPWLNAFRDGQREITQQELQGWAKGKFSNEVRFPSYLLHSADLELEGAPVVGFETFRDLANAVRNSLVRARNL